MDLPSDLPVEEAIDRYEASPDVEFAEPDFILKPSQTTSANDPRYPSLYGLNNTGQNSGTADADVDAANDDASVYDPDPVSGGGDDHGTHVAGTIAAEGNNNLGVVSVSWRTRIMPLKFLGPSGGYTSNAIKALNYAVTEGAKISNNSWGGGGSSQALLDAIKKADASGHLFIAAAGNGGTDSVGDNNDADLHYPSNYDSPNVISVAATDNQDALASFSNYGSSSVDLSAPGVNVLSTLPGNTYGSYSGTSMATPHVTEAAALLKSRNPSMDDAQLKARILESAENKTNLQEKTATGGRLNAQASLAEPTTAEDTTGPTVTSIKPTRTRNRTPRITAIVRDDRGGLEKSAIRLYIDGAEKTDFSYDPGEGGLSYTSARLSYARHTVRIVATDAAGNTTTESQSFRVVR